MSLAGLPWLFFFAPLLYRKNRLASFSFLVKEAKFLGELVSVCGAYHYAEERAVDDQDETNICKTAALMYQHGWVRRCFAERAAEVAHRGKAALTALEKLAKAPAKIVQSVAYPGILPQ